jgi:hypothetical protein
MVLFIPLMLAGVITFRVLVPYDRYAYFLCEPGLFGGHENCRFMGSSTEGLYKTVKRDYPAWFGVQIGKWDSNAYPVNFVEASSRNILGAHIVDAEPFALQGEDAARYMKSLVGMPASIQLGGVEKENSIIADGLATLTCNEFRFEDSPGLYTSNCWGAGWGGPVKFTVSGADNDAIQDLKNQIKKEEEWLHNDFITYQIITYPLFVYLFLIASGISWIVLKAVRFVRNG